MQNYIINDLDDNLLNGGRKARNDVFTFAKEAGFKEILLPFIIHPQDRSIKAKIKKLQYSKLTIPRLIKNVSDADVIVFQYPMYSTYLMNHVIADIKKYTYAKLIYVIHDIESIRMFSDSQTYSENEMNVLKQADGLIVHNHQMQQWLQTNWKLTCPMVNLEIFDYLNPQPVNTNLKYEKSVVFAGSLEKSKFLTKLNGQTPITLYGVNPASSYPASITYKGKLAPEKLPQYLTESFGLVWDGNDIDTCSGTYGNYLKYNAPHKTSLYLSSGVPVIIWRQAAMANYIEQNKVGLVIDNLNELDAKINSLSNDAYQNIKQNTLAIAQKLRSGFYIKKALNQIVKQVM